MPVALMGQLTSSSCLLVRKTMSCAPQFSLKLAKVTPERCMMPRMAGLLPAAPLTPVCQGKSSSGNADMKMGQTTPV